MRMSVRAKLGLGFGSIIAALVLTVVSLFFMVDSIYRSTKVVQGDDLPAAIAYFTLIDEAGDISKDAWMIVNGNITDDSGMRGNLESFYHNYDIVYPLESDNAQGKRELAQLKGYMDNFEQEFAKVRQIASQTARIDAMWQLEQTYFVPLEDLVERLAEGEATDADGAMIDLIAMIGRIETTMVGITLLVAIVAAAIAYRLSASFTRRIAVLDKQARLIADGQLNSDVFSDNADDELATLGRSIYLMRDSLKVMLTAMNDVSTNVRVATSDVAQTSNAIVEGAQLQNDKASLIATASEELTMTIAEVAQQSNETARLADQSGDAAQQGQAVIADLVSAIEQASVRMASMATEMHQLDDSSTKIGSVIKVIEDIAEQTNLLALNAAIEAARAGEFGRGFAVVADEVRALAERTTSATQEVAEMIKTIQVATQSAVAASEASLEQVRNGTEHSGMAVESLESIVIMASDLKMRIDSIATATEEQTSVTREIANDINAISEASDAQNRHAMSSANSVNELDGNVTELEVLINKFKLS
uniref:methyl-accepting chemotaxis protein n=1 Tax=Thaumasiovibrio occultus TaxID=1891184 RepID=UPI000B355C3A|nr:methyl-accepting chemotaxis protein [Thaumasiovibrio occultus]